MEVVEEAVVVLHFSCGSYSVRASVGGLPSLYSSYVQHAALCEEIGVSSSEGTALFVAVTDGTSEWPNLVVSQRFEPGLDSGFDPGIRLVPETHLLLIGAGTRLLAYDLQDQRRLWEDYADCGFWGWHQHGDVILMAAELELAAWDIRGNKLWSTFVEPPWGYTVHGGEVRLDVMGTISVFPLRTGRSPQG
ncbi:MAG TPA: hypothetical protein VK464_28650 [Symbiobacteriaceae bacterium]|jgi:hypothetical protein|nr:hypothetical protein [Symbiobacteriaceae bacterium]